MPPSSVKEVGRMNFSLFVDMLGYLLLGMAGIFVVVLAIIACTYGITILSTKIDRMIQKKKN